MKKVNNQRENQTKERITVEDKPEKPADLDELRKKLFSKEMTDDEVVSLGENRGQFFIRLPTRMTNKLDFKKGMNIKITLILNDSERRLILEAEH